MAIIRFLILSLALLASALGANTDLVGLIQIDSSGIPRAVNPITGSANVGNGLIFGSDGKIGPVDVLTQSEWATQRSTLDTQLAAKAATSHTHTFSSLTSKPTTLSGYGITDGVTSSALTSALSGKSDTGHTHAFSVITDKPTTLSGYGIADAVASNGALHLSTGKTYGVPGTGLPLTPSLWLKTSAGTEYNASTGTWTAAVGSNATQATSGKRPAAITTVPAMNGRNGVPFGPGKNLAISPSASWNTIFIVATRESANGRGLLANGAPTTFGYANLGMSNPGLLAAGSDSGGPSANLGGPRWSFGSHQPQGAAWLNKPAVYAFTYRKIATDTHISGIGNQRIVLDAWLNGQRTTLNYQLLASVSSPASFDLALLGITSHLTGSDTSYYWQGTISEVVTYARDLSAAEIQAASRALMADYGIPEPALNPQILVVGDSTSAGSNGPTWVNSVWSKRYAAATQYDPLGKTIEAVGGRTAQLALANAALYTPLVLPGQIVSVFIGTNDLDAGRTVAQLKADTQALCETYASAGGRVAVWTMMPRTGATANWTEAKRTEFNTWLRANYGQFASFIVDVAADSRFTSWSSTYFGDGAHHNSAGAEAAAEIFVAAVPL